MLALPGAKVFVAHNTRGERKETAAEAILR
jgi:hypothetical protein